MGKFLFTSLLAGTVIVMMGCAPRKVVSPPELRGKLRRELDSVTLPSRARGTLQVNGFKDFKTDFYLAKNGDTLVLTVPGPLGFPALVVRLTEDTLLTNGEYPLDLPLEISLLSAVPHDRPLSIFRIENVYLLGNHALAEGRFMGNRGTVTASKTGRLKKLEFEFKGGVLAIPRFSTTELGESYPAEINWRREKCRIRITLQAE